MDILSIGETKNFSNLYCFQTGSLEDLQNPPKIVSLYLDLEEVFESLGRRPLFCRAYSILSVKKSGSYFSEEDNAYCVSSSELGTDLQYLFEFLLKEKPKKIKRFRLLNRGDSDA